ncbi:uncharacterized protein [Chlorocebus sabaeus]|uniref:uncharacterized protein isoform X4 n=1 Tax=Chlorocebus sabaeus TaxID=60711 RepID=UPI003BF9C7CF
MSHTGRPSAVPSSSLPTPLLPPRTAAPESKQVADPVPSRSSLPPLFFQGDRCRCVLRHGLPGRWSGRSHLQDCDSTHRPGQAVAAACQQTDHRRIEEEHNSIAH